MSLAATWMDLEITILSEVSQTDKYCVIYIWTLKKKDTNESIYKTEVDPQIQETYHYQRGKNRRDKLGVWD